jgi:hypothetical protein
MKITARYKLLKSLKLSGRGLVVLGDLIDGDAKAGDFITFHTGQEEVTLQIAEIGMADHISHGEYWVELSFVYKGEKQKRALENLAIPMQVVEIIGK